MFRPEGLVRSQARGPVHGGPRKEAKVMQAVRILPDGRHLCLICRRAYIPVHATREEAMATQDLVSREQWISGVCSQGCWDSILPPEEEGEDDGDA